MRGTLHFYLSRIIRAIWFLPALFSLAAILTLAASGLSDPFVPRTLAAPFDLDVVGRILEILASSMLAVAIFSLTTMVAAIQAASQAATPRVRSLLFEDRTAQTAISIFIGTFLFSLLAVIGLSTGLYGDSGRFVLFLLTLVIIAAVVVALIRWIHNLSRIGGVSETIDRAETTTRKAFAVLAAAPCYGGRCCNALPEGAQAIAADRLGYVQHVDGTKLGALSEELGVVIHLAVRPGTYVDPTRPLAFVQGKADDETRRAVRAAFIIGGERAFDSDPSFGLIVLSEIASRALSPAVNDPGTAIDVIGTQTRVLDEWGALRGTGEPEVRYPHLSVADLDPDELLTDAFSAIARDGAAILEVQLRQQN